MVKRKFTKEFKLGAVKVVPERGVAVAQAARDFDMAEIDDYEIAGNVMRLSSSGLSLSPPYAGWI
ncbi:hypothetical protein CUR21_10240 [Pseudorhodobacter sp. MZDSW-24AT]|nr:hypothetical protein CUR21_10240 [Pseudorhodobacter sp. MZDSW-24AT]